MARIFARLKLTLLRNGLRRGWQQVVGMVMGAVILLPLAVLAGLGLALLRGNTDQRTVLVVAAALGWLGWAVLPLLGFGSDETLDASRLVLLPLTSRQLLTGLLTASLIGVGGAATVVIAAGAAIGAVPRGPGAALVVLAAVVFVAQCAVGSRAVVTSLSGLLRSRRGRDVTATIVALVVIAAQFLRFLVGGVVQRVGVDGLRRVAGVTSWMPPAWSARAMADGAQGRLVSGTVSLVAAVAFLALLWQWWRWGLARVLTTADTSNSARQGDAPRPPGELELFPRRLRWLPRTHAGAVAARELRYTGRDPRRRVALIVAVVVPVIAVGAVVLGGSSDPRAVLLAAGAGALAGMSNINTFGLDGGAYWVHVAVGGDPRPDIVGKNLAAAIIVVPIVAVTAVGLSVVTGGWAYLPAALLLGAAVLAVQLGVGDLASVLVPQPVAQTANPWATTNGQGCMAGLLNLAALASEWALLVPVIAAVAVGALVWTPLLVVAVPLAVAYGAVLWWVGVSWATRSLRGREPELLVKIDARRAA